MAEPGEGARTPEELNGRVLYGALVNALRDSPTPPTDAHYANGNTPTFGEFRVSDWATRELTAARDRSPLELLEGSERVAIIVDFPDTSHPKTSYTVVHPEDIDSSAFALPLVVSPHVPADWPPNEPFILRRQAQTGTPVPEFTVITDPANEPRLQELYTAVSPEQA